MIAYSSLLVVLIIVPSFGFERIVKDLNTILSSKGTAIDMRYSQRSCGRHCPTLRSVPYCPKAIDGNPWVYHGYPPRCFLTGVLFPDGKPCPKNAVLAFQAGSKVGRCVTPNPHGIQSTLQNSGVPKENACPYKFVYSKTIQHCIYPQSYSKANRIS